MSSSSKTAIPARSRMKTTAAIYVRVSTPDQHVESQLYDLRELPTFSAPVIASFVIDSLLKSLH